MKRIFLILMMVMVAGSAWATNYCADPNVKVCALFKTGSGTVLTDSSTNANHGAFLSSGHPAWAAMAGTGAPSYAPYYADFASGDYVNIGNSSASLSFNRGFSLIGWVYFTDNSSNRAIFSWGTGGWYLRMDSSHKLDFLASQTADVLEGSTPLSLNTWYNVAVTVDNSSPANVVLYVNGTSDGTGTTTQTFSSVNPKTIGNELPVGGDNLIGRLSEFAWFNRVLTPTEIADIKTNGLGSAVSCGDSVCNGTETCGTCPGDCGACPVCGDAVCNGTDTCSNCPADCGACPHAGLIFRGVNLK